MSCRLPVVLLLLLLTLVALMAATARYASPTFAAASLKPGDIILGSSFGVWWVDRMSGTLGQFSSQPSVYDAPRLVATGPNGEVYVADNRYIIDDFTRRPTVARVDPATGTPSIVASGGFASITGLSTDQRGQLVVADESNMEIVRVDPSNGGRTVIARGGLIRYPSDVAVEPDGSILTVVSVTSSYTGPRQILRIRAATDAQEVVSVGGLFVQPWWVTSSPDGSIYVSDLGGYVTPPRVLRVHPQSGAQAVLSDFAPEVSSEYARIGGVLTDSLGIVFVAGRTAQATEGIFRVDPHTGQRTFMHQPSSRYPIEGIAMVKAASSQPCPSSTRSPVSVRTSNLGNGRLQVTVRANGNPNAIRAIRLGAAPNATVETPPTIVGPDASFVVRRTAPGAVTLPFTVTDACGDWPTFVGGGPSAF